MRYFAVYWNGPTEREVVKEEQTIEVVIRHLRALMDELEARAEELQIKEPPERLEPRADEWSSCLPPDNLLNLESPSPGSGRRSEWRLVEERPDGVETYRWPDSTDTYTRFAIYEADEDGRTHRFAVGTVKPENEHWGRKRIYKIVHQLDGDRKVPWGVFMEPDDYEMEGELIALIRGKGPSGRGMYRPAEPLPPEYEQFKTDVFKARVPRKGAFNRRVVAVDEDDEQTMLDFGLTQAKLRGGL